MAELSIKVSIANRIYPLRINTAEEENVRKAAKLINDKIQEYEKSFSVKDKQDLLAMCVLHFATDVINNENKPIEVKDDLEKELTEIDNLLTNYLDNLSKDKQEKIKVL